MKSLFILVAVVAATSAFASDLRIIAEDDRTITLVPKIEGAYVRASSDIDVVCKELGFINGAVAGSAVKHPWHEPFNNGQTAGAVKVRSDGSISNPRFNQRMLLQISCYK